MFAPLVAKQKSAPPRRSAVAAQRPSQAAVAQGQLLQRTIGNQAMLRLLPQRATLTLNEPGLHQGEENAARMTGREAVPSWDFSKIPIFPHGPAERAPPDPLFAAGHLSGHIQPKLKIGAIDDPLEKEADHVAHQVMQMPAPGIFTAAVPPQISRKCADCDAAEKLQQKQAREQSTAGEAPGIVQLIERAERSSGKWIEEGGLMRPARPKELAPHRH